MNPIVFFSFSSLVLNLFLCWKLEMQIINVCFFLYTNDTSKKKIAFGEISCTLSSCNPQFRMWLLFFCHPDYIYEWCSWLYCLYIMVYCVLWVFISVTSFCLYLEEIKLYYGSQLSSGYLRCLLGRKFSYILLPWLCCSFLVVCLQT